jgi:hypothetical protein
MRHRVEGNDHEKLTPSLAGWRTIRHQTPGRSKEQLSVDRMQLETEAKCDTLGYTNLSLPQHRWLQEDCIHLLLSLKGTIMCSIRPFTKYAP